MRPRFTTEETLFLLGLLQKERTRVKRENLDFIEEAEHLNRIVPALRHHFIFEDPTTYRAYHQGRDRLKELEWQCLPTYFKHMLSIQRLIVKLERLNEHRRGRLPRVHLS